MKIYCLVIEGAHSLNFLATPFSTQGSYCEDFAKLLLKDASQKEQETTSKNT